MLLDVLLSDMSGFDLIALLKGKLPRVKIILVTMLGEPFYVSEGFQQVADGYVLKQSASTEIMTAIHTVMSYRR